MREELSDFVEFNNNVKVELIKEGNVVKELKQKNFIGNPFKAWGIAMMASAFTQFLTNSERGDVGIIAEFPIQYLLLTDNRIPVLQDEKVIPGNILGYAEIETYAGTDTKRGTINLSESKLNISKNEIKLVFDWPTHAANGLIGTIGFCYSRDGKTATGIEPIFNETNNSAYDYKYVISEDGRYVFYSARDYKISRLDLETNELIDAFIQINGESKFQNSKIAIADGEYIYYIYDGGSNDYINRFHIITGEHESYGEDTRTFGDDITWMALSDQHICVCTHGQYVYFYDRESGIVEREYTKQIYLSLNYSSSYS